jgi:hypothetical protein
MPRHAAIAARPHGVLRLRSCFASRSSSSAQDDRAEENCATIPSAFRTHFIRQGHRIAHAATTTLAPASAGKSKAGKTLGIVCWVALVAIAVAFVLKYVFHYYLNYNAAAFDPYWSRRGVLLLHITGGMIALLTGPWQFFTGLTGKRMNVHRYSGRVFLGGVTVGVTGAMYLAFTTTFGWAFGFGIFGLAAAWASTTAMAYYAIRKRLVETHKEWMIRAYVVTFAFVTFRVFSDYGPTSHLKPPGDLAITLAWACWVVPLGITEVILQLRRMRTASARV